MNTINFISGGMMGDFIHSLSAVDNLCRKYSSKANIYISNSHGGDIWRFGLDKVYNDLENIILSQPYVNKFGIATEKFNEEFINLNDWRIDVANTHAVNKKYLHCWSEVLSKRYDYKIQTHLFRNKWMYTENKNIDCENKILIHRSKHRHNGNFNWNNILNSIDEDIIFITTDKIEWDIFQFKSDKIKPLVLNSINDICYTINSCKYFIGNQSAPFAIASALDVPRLVELDYDPAMFYVDEHKYSNNISCYLNDSIKVRKPNCIVQI